MRRSRIPIPIFLFAVLAISVACADLDAPAGSTVLVVPNRYTIVQIGFSMAKLEVRLSNLMAFDATMFGNWGCDPLLYPEVLDLLAEGKIQLKPFVKQYPLAEINDVFDAAHHGKLVERAVLVP